MLCVGLLVELCEIVLVYVELRGQQQEWSHAEINWEIWVEHRVSVTDDVRDNLFFHVTSYMRTDSWQIC